MTMADVNTVENSFIVTTGETNGRFISLGIEGRGGRVKVVASAVPKKCNVCYQTHCMAHTVLLKWGLFSAHKFISMSAFSFAF